MASANSHRKSIDNQSFPHLPRQCIVRRGIKSCRFGIAPANIGWASLIVTEVRTLPRRSQFGLVAQQRRRSPYDWPAAQRCSEIAVTTPSNPLPLNDEPPGEIPEELQGIAQRLQAAIDEVLVAKQDADEPAASEASERDLSGAASREVIDRRLYFPDSEGWELGVKSGQREYCSYRNPGEEWFHLLLDGELFLQFGEEKVCLNCAFRNGLLTDDRLFWQKGHRRPRIFPVSKTDPVFDDATETPIDVSDQPLAADDDLKHPTERQT